MYLILPRVGDSPLAVVSSISYGPIKNTWLNDDCVFSWPAPRREDDGVTLLIEKLKKLERKFGRIGMPMGHE